MAETTVMDLSALVAGIHYGAGYPKCKPVRLLRELKAWENALPHGTNFVIVEFTTHANTNPDKVTCIGCWHEHPEVQHAFAQRQAKNRSRSGGYTSTPKEG